MIAGGYRGDFYLQTYGGTLMGKILMDAVFSLIFISRPSYLFDEDTGESKRIPNMMFIDYGGGRFKFTYSWGKDEDFPIFAK